MLKYMLCSTKMKLKLMILILKYTLQSTKIKTADVKMVSPLSEVLTLHKMYRT